MSPHWEVPRCGHGHILLGCPHGDCAEQNEYLATQSLALDAWYAQQRADARALVRNALGLVD